MKIGFVSGTAIHVTDKQALSNKATGIDAIGKVKTVASIDGRAQVPDSITQSRNVPIKDIESLKNAIHQVRDDNSKTNWMLASYDDDKTTLVLRGFGEGGIDEMVRSYIIHILCFN